MTSSAEELVLKKGSLGSLKLSSKTLVSPSILQKLFPDYSISHRIGSGDSPDYHLLMATNKKGEMVFRVKSFTDVIGDGKSQEYGIDLLIIDSPEIIDEHGIRVGDRLEKALKKRGQ